MTLHVNLTPVSMDRVLSAHPDRNRPGDEVLDYAGTVVYSDPSPRRTALRAIRRSSAVDFYVDDLDSAQLGRLSVLKLVFGAKTMTVLDLQGRARRLYFRQVLADTVKRSCFRLFLLPSLRLRETVLLRATLASLARAEAVPLRAERPRRVAYLRTDVITVVRAGGSIAHISGVANALAALGIEVKLWSTAQIATLRTPIRLVSLRSDLPELLPGREHFVHGRRFVATVEPEIRVHAPDLIYWRHSPGGLAGAVLSQHLRVPLVLEYNGSEIRAAELWGKGAREGTAPGPIPHRELFLLAEELSFKLAGRIVVVSSVLRDELIERGVPASKIQVEPNGVDLERFPRETLDRDRPAVREKLGFRPEHVVAGFIGTFGKWHGVQILARAVKPALARFPSLRFLIVGDGLYMPEVRATLERDGVADKVVLAGLVPQAEAPGLLNACDFHVSPHVPNEDGSQFFGSPTKLFEYMALGRGIVASSLNQIGEVLRHDETALLVPPGDLDALVAGLVALAGDPARRDRLGRAARAEVAERYTWEANVRGLLDSIAAAARHDRPVTLPVVQAR